MKKLILILLAILPLISSAQVYKDPKASVEDRINSLLSQMTLEEKINYISGINGMFIKPIERFNLPTIKMNDGPVGAKDQGKTTAYPASVLSAATWDTSLVHQLGVAIGKDCRAKGVHILLGPGVNIHRAPMGGRNFEYLGEDPYLSSCMAVNYILGVQSQRVVATVKHFAANNQEYDRNFISSDMDERTLQEIYLPTFKAAVQKAHVTAVMNSYNLLNGVYTTHNNHLNNEILKGKWGFKGILMSDWGSTHDGIAALKGGLDLEMPSGEWINTKNVLPAIQKGEISEELINDKVRRILRVIFSYGFYDLPQTDTSLPKDNPASAAVALNLARNGVVLLKNQKNILPLNPLKVKKIAIIGPNGDTYNAGGGSSYTEPFHSVSFLQGLKQIAKDAEITFTPGIPNLSVLATKSVFYNGPGSKTKGLKAAYFANDNLRDAPITTVTEQTIDHVWANAPDVKGIPEDHFSIRWTGVIRPVATTNYKFSVKGDDGYRLWIDNQCIIDFWSEHGPVTTTKELHLEAGKEYAVKLEYFESGGEAEISFAWFQRNEENFTEAIDAAKKADVAILCVGFNSKTEGEGSDRTFELPSNQDSLIKIVAQTNPNTIVILNSGGNVYMEKWLPSVKGLIHAWYPGQEGGIALAEIVMGKVNPSGKLPVSFEKKWADNPTYTNYYDPDGDKHVQYKEGLLIGYRYYDTKKVEPLFPFGFGLSYTSFAYANLTVKVNQENNKIAGIVTFDITNTGAFDGAEIPQLYIHDVECPVERPYKELKGFSKVFLKKGETKQVTLTLDESAFSYYKTSIGDFGFDAGDFEIMVGSSSKDSKLQKTVKIK